MSSPSLPYDPDHGRAEQPRGPYPPAPGAGSDAAQVRAGARSRIQLVTRHHPRVLAALCYTVPLVPAWTLLARKGDRRESPFVRFHAAQSLVFYGMIAAAQIALYVALVILGGLVRDDLVASLIALALVVIYVALAAVIAFTWASLLADCIRGDARPLPLAGRLALRLERFAPRQAWARRHGRRAHP